MTRRKKFFLGGGVLLLLVVGIAIAIGLVLRQRARQQEIREALEVASDDFGNIFSEAMSNLSFAGPKLRASANLDGNVTTLTVTFSNESDSRLKDLVFQGFTLGGLSPREKATIPIRLATLEPKASLKVVLRYEKVPWLGDDVGTDRVDLGWATKFLDYSANWVVEGNYGKQAGRPGVKIKTSDSAMSSSYMGISVELDRADAQALKDRRDAERKAKGGG